METYLIEVLSRAATKALTQVKARAGKNAFPNTQKTTYSDTNDLEAEGRKIAEDLVRQAISSGMKLAVFDLSDKSLSGGNTAEFVGELILKAPFVLKMDSSNKKLVEEALAVRSIKHNPSLPQKYRDSWPDIYAMRSEPPYAYLMEYFRQEEGWFSIQSLLYDQGFASQRTSALVTEIIGKALYTLYLGFEYSVNNRQLPSIFEDYVLRIIDRLKKTAMADSRFKSQPLVINGQLYQPWQQYADLLQSSKGKLLTIAPPFSTIVHGDPNPGNLLVNLTNADLPLKMIDPKEWIVGDYLFDVCKLTHFVEVTGPVELPEGAEPTLVTTEQADKLVISYELKKPVWTAEIIDSCLHNTEHFADSFGDQRWRERYDLGMAANLLGLPLGRLKKGRRDAATVMYAEGIKWLDKFCKNISQYHE